MANLSTDEVWGSGDQDSMSTNDVWGAERSPSREYPGGVAGSVKANLAGQLHTMTGLVGLPGDVALWGAKKIGRALTSTAPLRREAEPKGGRRQRAEEGSATSGEEFVANYIEPFLPTSKWARKVLDLPGRAVGLEGHATYNDINEVPEVYRAQARAGEAIGSAYPFAWGAGAAGNAMGAARALTAGSQVTPSVTRNILNSQIAEQAQAARSGLRGGVDQLMGLGPQRAPALGAAAGAYGAETVFPGSEVAQLVGQLGGGLAGAGAGMGVNSAVGRATSRIRDPLSTLSPEGAKTAIARSLGPQFEKHGEDVEGIIRNLSAPDVVPGALPAEKSGSRVLMGVQNKLAAGDENLANVINDKQGQFRSNIGRSVDESFAPGEERALSAAAQAHDDFISREVEAAENAARVAATPLAGMSAAEQETLNIRARNAVEAALRRARTEENRLWDQVPNEAPIQPDSLIDSYNAVRGGMLPEQRLPSVIEQAIRRMSESADPVPFREVRILRSELLNEARKARAADDLEMARRLNEIANGPPGQIGGALADMSAVGDPAVRMAREYSALLHDKFSRSFAGDILGMSPSGEPAIRPALTLERTFSGKPAQQAQQARELRSATEPVGMGPPRPTADPSSEIGQAQEEFLRNATKRFVNPETGRVNAAAAQRFLRDNAPVLEQFPTFRDQIDRAVAAELAAQQVSASADDFVKQSAFARVIKSGERPAIAVGKVLMGDNPVRDFAQLARIARSSGPDAVAGLRASVLAFISDRAAGNGGVSFAAMKEALTKPLVRGGPSILSMMENNGIISAVQRRTISERIDLGSRHEISPGQAVRIDNVGDESGRVARWGARILGAKMASWMGATHGGAGTSLQVANIFASGAEHALARLPTDRARQIISRAMQSEDPSELIDILERISSSSVSLRRGMRHTELFSLIRPLLPQTESETQIDEGQATRYLEEIRGR